MRGVYTERPVAFFSPPSDPPPPAPRICARGGAAHHIYTHILCVRARNASGALSARSAVKACGVLTMENPHSSRANTWIIGHTQSIRRAFDRDHSHSLTFSLSCQKKKEKDNVRSNMCEEFLMR